jgi:hypothetical protein
MKNVRYVAIVAIGGMANVWGALFFGVLLNFLSLRGAFGTFDDAVFGLALIAIMVLGGEGGLSTGGGPARIAALLGGALRRGAARRGEPRAGEPRAGRRP